MIKIILSIFLGALITLLIVAPISGEQTIQIETLKRDTTDCHARIRQLVKESNFKFFSGVRLSNGCNRFTVDGKEYKMILIEP